MMQSVTNGGTLQPILMFTGDTDSKPDLLLTICMKNHQTNDHSIELLTSDKCFSVEYLTEQQILQWLLTLTETTQTNSTDTRCLL